MNTFKSFEDLKAKLLMDEAVKAEYDSMEDEFAQIEKEIEEAIVKEEYGETELCNEEVGSFFMPF